MTIIICDPVYKEHCPPPGHPESPARYDAALEGIAQALGDPLPVKKMAPRPATVDEVMLCHTREYIDMVREDVKDTVPCLRTGDTDVCERSFEVALLAAGGVLTAVDAVAGGEADNAFCTVRPPGHHATADCGMGFCIFNNIAIGARYAREKHGVERVLIVDWDVHHGNGTQDIFYEDASVFFFSTHQWPLYPGTGLAHETGAGKGKGYTLNCPLAAGSGRVELVNAFRGRLLPAMRKFKPEFVLISAGFDGRIGDPIGGLTLGDSDFAELTGLVMDVADEYAEGRIVSTLEGGYRLSGLASAVGAHVRRLTAAAGEGGGDVVKGHEFRVDP